MGGFVADILSLKTAHITVASGMIKILMRAVGWIVCEFVCCRELSSMHSSFLTDNNRAGGNRRTSGDTDQGDIWDRERCGGMSSELWHSCIVLTINYTKQLAKNFWLYLSQVSVLQLYLPNCIAIHYSTLLFFSLSVAYILLSLNPGFSCRSGRCQCELVPATHTARRCSLTRWMSSVLTFLPLGLWL